MNILQESTLSMYEAVVLLIDANVGTVTALHGFSTVYTPFKAKVATIKSVQQQQRGAGSAGATKRKADLRRDVTFGGLKLVNGLRANFAIIGDNTHDAILLVSNSSLNRLADTNLVSDMRNILALANSVAAGIANYGIDAAWLTNYAATITAYDAAIAIPRMTVVDRATYTAVLETNFAEAKQLLGVMALLVKTIEFDNPNFYSRFTKSCKVISAGSRNTAFRMAIKSTDGVAQTGFTVQLFRVSTGDTVLYKTNKSGTLVRQNMVDGVYEITVSKHDYAPLSGKVVLISGETYVLEITVDTAVKVFKGGRNPKTGEVI
jgi:hypothetical protein